MAARRTIMVGASVLAALLGLLLLTTAVLWFVQRDAALPNTTVAGVEVGGLSEPEVREELAPLASAREGDEVTFTFRDRTFTVTPSELGYTVDIDATAETALARGREGLPGDIATRWRSLWRERGYELVERIDDPSLRAWVDQVADEVDREASPGDVTIAPDSLEVSVEFPHGAVEVRRDEAVAALRTALTEPGPDELELPADTQPQPVTDEQVEEVAEQVRRAIAAPLVLEGVGTNLTLEPDDVAELIEVEPTEAGDDLQLEVTEERVEEILGSTVERFETEPVDARYTASRTPPVRFDDQSTTSFSPVEAEVGLEEGRPGTRFDPQRAADQLTELLREGARQAELALERIDPDLPTERAEELRPTHLIGTFTTYYTGGQPRSHNIQQIADVVDGTLLLPGEQFSINETSGPRECHRGYQEAGMILRGELVDVCGGGVSQFGTTTFNAAFFAGVQLDEWKAHSWYLSRYPMGREATLNYGTLDVRFTNTSDGAILVKTDHTAESVTVSLYGQPIAERVTAEHGQPHKRRSPDTRTRTVHDLECGQERTIQEPNDGFTVHVVRRVERLDGSVDERTITTVYSPVDRIVERGAC